MQKTDTCPAIAGGKIETLRIVAHPVRIAILEELSKGVKCVSDLEEFLDIRQPNVSQHLALMRAHKVIDYYMDGRSRCYFLRDPLALSLLTLLKEDDGEDLPMPACCPSGRGPLRNQHLSVKGGP